MENQNPTQSATNENIEMVVLWINANPNKKAPELKGYVNYPDGSRKEIVLWRTQSLSGNEYFRGRIQFEKNVNQNPQDPTTNNDDEKDGTNPPF